MKRVPCLLLISALAFTPNGIGQEKKSSPQFAQHLPGGGVADPARKVGYYPNPTNGVDALDLATGKVLWTALSGGRPLLATDNLLIVQKPNAIDILATTADGKRIRGSQADRFAGMGQRQCDVRTNVSQQCSHRRQNTLD